MSKSLALSMMLLALTIPTGPVSADGGRRASSEIRQEKPELRAKADPTRARMRLEREVRHELVMLPYYSVFDNLAYRVNGGRVELFGQVVRPTLKSDAERAVKDIEGVEEVVNQIEVLPLSPNDDRIRRSVFRAIYGNSVLSKYALQSVPPIHIIVNHGNVTLEGAVSTELERNLAYMQASRVSGVFSVTNHLVLG